ncbi:MAG: cupin domain-containing protein [Planctomycetota bacterium]
MTDYAMKHPPAIGHARTFVTGHNPGQTGHCLLYGPDTAGSLSVSVAKLKKDSQAPLHEYSREDETFYVISGELDARVGDNHHTLRAGDAIFLPRGLRHRLRCLSDEAQVLMLIHRPGLEHFFDEVDQAIANGPADPTKMQEIAQRYGVTIFPDDEA